MKGHGFARTRRLKLDNGKYDDAIAGYGKALQLDPNNSAAREGLARAQKAKAAEDALR